MFQAALEVGLDHLQWLEEEGQWWTVEGKFIYVSQGSEAFSPSLEKLCLSAFYTLSFIVIFQLHKVLRSLKMFARHWNRSRIPFCIWLGLRDNDLFLISISLTKGKTEKGQFNFRTNFYIRSLLFNCEILHIGYSIAIASRFSSGWKSEVILSPGSLAGRDDNRRRSVQHGSRVGLQEDFRKSVCPPDLTDANPSSCL